MTLNPSDILFYNNSLISRKHHARYQQSTTNFVSVPNQIFDGVLKVLQVYNGSGHADIKIIIISGPTEFIDKIAEISATHLNKALEDNTLLKDADGIYIKGTWVFRKQGQIVRLNEYKT